MKTCDGCKFWSEATAGSALVCIRGGQSIAVRTAKCLHPKGDGKATMVRCSNFDLGSPIDAGERRPGRVA